MEGEGEDGGVGFYGDFCFGEGVLVGFVWIREGAGLRTFLDLLEAAADAGVGFADDVDAGDFVWAAFVEVVKGVEGGDAEGVGAAEEDAEGLMGFRGCAGPSY